jgi:hypothetical protein
MLLRCGVAFSQNAPPDTQKSAALYSLKKDQWIRVEKSDRSVIAGKFRAIKDDSLLLSAGSAKEMAIAISDLQLLLVRTNSARVGGRVGAILGAIPGAILGGYMAGLANIDCESHCRDLTVPRMTMGSITGAPIPKWERVYP